MGGNLGFRVEFSAFWGASGLRVLTNWSGLRVSKVGSVHNLPDHKLSLATCSSFPNPLPYILALRIRPYATPDLDPTSYLESP